MTTDYLPRTDAALLAYSANYSTLMTAAPTTYGCTAAMATQLATLQSAYAAALEAATNPATRGGSTIFAKDQARRDLVAYIRQLTRTVQGTATVTDQQKYDLGVTVHTGTVSPIPVPSQSPTLVVKSTNLNVVRIELRTTTGPGVTKRGKPPGVAGAAIFSFVGATPPADTAAWTFQGNTTRTVVDVAFDPGITPGAKVWLCAFWFNPRMLSGYASTPVSTNVPGGGVAMNLASGDEPMAEAA
jgi:hypothetical protein